MSAPERIWANEGLEWHSFDCSDVKAGWTHPYILATRAALAASPEVQALVREAEALVVERAAEEVDRHYAAGDMGNPGHWVRAIAPADGLAAVEALRKERDEAQGLIYAARLERNAAEDQEKELAEELRAVRADRDRLAAANAALEAKLARLVETVERAIKDTMLRLGKHPDIRRIMAPQVMWGAGDSCISAIRAALAEVQADARREGGE